MTKTKLSIEQINLIKTRLARGDTQKQIAEEFGTSEKTIQRIKKASEEAGDFAEAKDKDNIHRILSDYHITDTSRYASKKYEQVRREMILFEDPEEGWTYDTTKDDPTRKMTSKWFRFIAYPESAPEGWRDRLEQLCEIAVSPLHDKDKWFHDSPEYIDKTTGEFIPKGALYVAYKDTKKSHWHGIAVFDHPIALWKANELITRITRGPRVQLCGTLKGAYEYFLHINDPDKYQGYDKDEIYRSAHFRIEPNSIEKAQIFQSICNHIVTEEIDNRVDLVKLFGDKPDYLTQIKSGSFISGLLAENWLKHNPDGRIRRVTIVDDEKKGR